MPNRFGPPAPREISAESFTAGVLDGKIFQAQVSGTFWTGLMRDNFSGLYSIIRVCHRPDAAPFLLRQAVYPAYGLSAPERRGPDPSALM